MAPHSYGKILFLYSDDIENTQSHKGIRRLFIYLAELIQFLRVPTRT